MTRWEMSFCSWDCGLGIQGAERLSWKALQQPWMGTNCSKANQHNPAASQNSPKMRWINTLELASSFYLITFMDVKSSITN